MQLTKIIILAQLLIMLLVVGCAYEFPVTNVNEGENLGSFNPEEMYILGSSLSAGLMDGALYAEGQNLAFGSILANNFNLKSDASNYGVLLVDSENGYNNELEGEGSNFGKFNLSFRTPKSSWPQRLTTNGEKLSEFTDDLTGITNYSIPDVKSFHFDDYSTLSQNKYFDRIQGITGSESLLDLVISKNPSVLIFEPGTFDIFNYAINGGVGEVNPNSQPVGNLDLTPVQVFENNLNQMVNRLLDETNADIFIINIPDPFVFPYFKTLPWHFTPDEWVVLNTNDDPVLSSYNQFNLRVQEYNRTVNYTDRRPLIVFDNNGGALFRSKVIEDEYLPFAQDDQGQEIPKWRQMTQSDYFLYNAEIIQTESLNNYSEPTIGALVPLGDEFIITDEEIDLITERRILFNSVIADLVNKEPRIHLVDLSGMITEVLGRRLTYDGVSYTLSFDKKGIVSADGYTLNARGHALLANEIIKMLNINFNADIEFVDVNNQPGTNIGLQF